MAGRSKRWSPAETRYLIRTLEEMNIWKRVDGRKHRNAELYKTVTRKLVERGFRNRDENQVKNKWKSLKQEYNRAKIHNSKNPSKPSSFEFYADVDRLLGRQPLGNIQHDGIEMDFEESNTSVMSDENISDEDEGSTREEQPQWETSAVSGSDSVSTTPALPGQRKHSGHLRSYNALSAAAYKRKSDAGTSSINLKMIKLEETPLDPQRSVDIAVLNYIVNGLQPLCIVEQSAFQCLIQDLQPNYTLMSQSTVLHELATATAAMKDRVRERIRKIPYIATTTDCWTVRGRSFICITAHWLDPSSFDRQSVGLACRQLKGAHTFNVLASAMNDIHTEYDISEKIVRTTTDNGSNFLKAFQAFEEDENGDTAKEATDEHPTQDYQDEEVDFINVSSIMTEDDGLQYLLPKHHQCACHLLNLVSTVDANDANKMEAYKKLSSSAFSKCQTLWNKAAKSESAEQLVEEHCELELMQPTTPRWSSFFLAVERLLRITKEQGEGAVRDVCAALDIPMFSQADIAFLVEYASTMAPVAKAIKILQDNPSIQMGWLLPTISTLNSKLDKSRASLRFCKPLVDALQDGLKRRFGQMMSEPELVAAAILHPKFKTSWTADDEVINQGLRFIREHLPNHEQPLEPQTDDSCLSDDEDFFFSMKNVHTQATTAKQLDGYLASVAGGMDVLAYYPAVSSLSLKLNTPLPASAASDMFFSADGLTFSPQRGITDSDNFENQLLLKVNKDFFKFE